VDLSTWEVEVECLPNDIPEHITVDISELHLHQTLKVEDLDEIPGVRIMTDPSTTLVAIQAPTAEEVVEEEPEEEEIMAEGEEPEVIKKDKEEEDKEAKGDEKKE
jgi:large subunit ribosomal protein L25